ncbi:RNA methyltransferase, partial [Bacillus haynesii]|uniref:TrmH family RNA methyltransferase n=1 Tax=Bacillus haynesii TaxID=1925021 RepID=UPI002292944B|nr:RNA methyltransferase [Bacillus haynesii]
EPSPAFALLIGNEGSGVDPDLLAQTAQNLYVPIYGKAESLNVAAAAAVLLYHLRG